MPYVTVGRENSGDINLYYVDWGAGQPVVFSHGWPLSADAFEDQMFFLASRGYRCIAHDRRGHGRSSQTWNGNDMDTYADDLAALVETLDLKDAIHVGHSTGGGEVARYIGRHGTKRVAKAVLISAVAPLMLKTPANAGERSMLIGQAAELLGVSRRTIYYRIREGRLLTIRLTDLMIERHTVLRKPWCPACLPTSETPDAR